MITISFVAQQNISSLHIVAVNGFNIFCSKEPGYDICVCYLYYFGSPEWLESYALCFQLSDSLFLSFNINCDLVYQNILKESDLSD